jgi:hypothetical protein
VGARTGTTGVPGGNLPSAEPGPGVLVVEDDPGIAAAVAGGLVIAVMTLPLSARWGGPG